MTTTADGLFKVDGAKCLKCGLCVQDCAFGALRMDDSRAAYAVMPTPGQSTGRSHDA